jgi:L-seryl-tRNA(Ser) seleniumtransferase
MWSRRRFLEIVSGLPIVGGIVEATTMPAAAAAAPTTGHDYFRELVFLNVTNATGTYTAMTTSLMPPEVLRRSATRPNLVMSTSHDKVGERIATLLHCEAAMVTSGAASALTLERLPCSPARIARRSSTFPTSPI